MIIAPTSYNILPAIIKITPANYIILPAAIIIAPASFKSEYAQKKGACSAPFINYYLLLTI